MRNLNSAATMGNLNSVAKMGNLNQHVGYLTCRYTVRSVNSPHRRSQCEGTI
jgi:hypothetical protein